MKSKLVATAVFVGFLTAYVTHHSSVAFITFLILIYLVERSK